MPPTPSTSYATDPSYYSSDSSSTVDSEIYRRDSSMSPYSSNSDTDINSEINSDCESDVDPEVFNRDTPFSPEHTYNLVCYIVI